MRKIKTSGAEKRNHAIRPVKSTADTDIIRFSFKHFDCSIDKFSIEGRSHEYFGKVLERLKALSELKVREFQTNRSKALRAHQIDWNDTSEKEGFRHLNSQLRDIPAVQFQISANEHGRVHGFIIDNIFFVIWLDPDHNLYD